MSDEILKSFKQVFSSLIKGTNTFPSVIITDNDLAIDATIANLMPNIYHIHCIYHIGQNLLKNLKSKLGSEYNDFIKAWYKMRNTLSQIEFDRLWDSLLERYPASESYLNRALGSQKHRQALAYTSRIFIGGIQTTQRVEGQNAIIKSAINSHTSILDLFQKIELQFNRVSTTIQYKNQAHSVTGSTLIHSSHDFSPVIDKWIIDYLTPAALSMQRQEISQAIWYSLQQVDKNRAFEIEDEIELPNTNFAEDTVDVPLILLKELIPINKVDDVIEIWELVHHRCTKKNYVVLFNDKSHLCTCLGLVRCGIVC